MSGALKKLLELLQLEQLEQNLFRGASEDLGWGAVFGGQVLGQALFAAAQTAPKDRLAHSLHGYFLRPGDVHAPVVYDVERIRDGQSFTTRRVVAVQHGQAIFHMSASFQIEELGFEHAAPMPGASKPEGLPSDRALAQTVADKMPAPFRAWALRERAIEMRPVDVLDPLSVAKRPAQRKQWYRAAGALPDDASLHRCLLAYASDFHFLGTAMQPHGVSVFTPSVQVASLDHAMWFHRSFRFDEWLLYAVESPSASGARAWVRGQFFDREGRLVASSAQEGLIRSH